MKLLASIFIVLLIVVWGNAADYYVSKSGSNSNPGTEAQPWSTIQKAANTLVSGDTVYIKAGTYNERVIPQNSGAAGKYITYTAYSNDTVIIDGTGINLPYDWGGLIDITGKSYLKISGLQVKNAGPNDNNCGILIDNGYYITIENNYTYNTASSGIAAWDSSYITIDNNEVVLACNDGEQECITAAVTSNFEIKNNHVHHSGPGSRGGEGIDAKDGAYNGKVYNNHVHDTNRLGIYVDAWDKDTYNIEVYRNIVHDINGNDGFTLASESGGLLKSIKVYNNIVYNAGENGISISRNGDSSTHPMQDITIINNTCYNNGSPAWGGGIAVDNPDVQNLVIRNNILSQNIYYQMEVETGVPMGELTVDHNLIHGFRHYEDEIKGDDYVEGDPLFVSASGADFHLQSNSPAIDNGSSTGAPSNDYEGNSRPQGSGYDIGAYEYIASATAEPEISLNKKTINVTVISGSTTAVTQTFTISNSGTGTLNWSVSDNAAWLSTSPASGTETGTVTVTVDPTGLSTGTYTGTVTVTSANASNSPQTVTVNLLVKSAAGDQDPFGQFDTPVHLSTVRSSVPVTGWALDDVAVETVKIYRGPISGEGSTRVYIGDANFVEGARPDVEAAFPDYPNNSRAGWGYMMLTNFLPGKGNGTFTLYAVAVDGAGHEVTLGTKTITCDNANAVKPFGAIDAPGQGGTASGSSFINWGWALTPMPNSIPTDGSTINISVDGVNLGHPVYNVYRADIADLFPGYANSNGAVGYFYLDTTAYHDGVHTIQWTAVDSAGNTDGIGSRYFTVQNAGEDRQSSVNNKKEFNLDLEPQKVYPYITFEIKELERIELNLAAHLTLNTRHPHRYYGCLISGKKRKPLPIGSTFDSKRGIFYWQPGPGFFGNYEFVFVAKDYIGNWYKRNITIRILPKFYKKEKSIEKFPVFFYNNESQENIK